MTLAGLIARTERMFRAARLHYGHGTRNARDEAAWLVLRSLGLPFDAPLEHEVDALGQRRVERLARRRIAERLPLAYLLKEAWIAGHAFYVDRRVIVPRSHIAFLFRKLKVKPKRILDACTGSGCLAILAARAFRKASVVATDISADALAVAARNVRQHRLQKRVKLVRADLFAGRNYDLIVANPPYVPSGTMRKLPPEYRWEPGLALAAGSDGLDLVRRIISLAPRFLTPNGVLVCEVGEGKRAVERAYPRLPFVWPVPEVFVLERGEMG